MKKGILRRLECIKMKYLSRDENMRTMQILRKRNEENTQYFK